jgi:hypothetical protein
VNGSSRSDNPGALVTAARSLLLRPDPRTAGIWPRGAALLARQALESALEELWQRRAPGLEQCSARAQLLCLPEYLRQGDLAERVAYAWSGLSRACHHHAYELPPTAAELESWIEIVEELVDAVSAHRDPGSGKVVPGVH